MTVMPMEEMRERRPPGRPRSQKTERDILCAALDLLASHGVRGLTIEAVAAKAGTAKTTLYRRWSNKNDLILDALEYAKGPIERPPGNSVREDLLFILVQLRDRRQNDYAVRITSRLMSEWESYPELVAQFRERIIRPRRQICFGILRRGIEQGIIREDIDVELVTDLLCSPIFVCHTTRPTSYTDADLEFFVDTALRGLNPQWVEPH